MSNSFLLLLGGAILFNFTIMFKDSLFLLVAYIKIRYDRWDEGNRLMKLKTIAEVRAAKGFDRKIISLTLLRARQSQEVQSNS